MSTISPPSTGSDDAAVSDDNNDMAIEEHAATNDQANQHSNQNDSTATAQHQDSYNNDHPPAVTVTDYQMLTEVEWGPSMDDPAYDTDQDLAPRPRRQATDACNCRPSGTPCCLDLSCVLFACQEECPKNCPAGMDCGNRRLQRPQSLPRTEIFNAGPHKGRGLRVLQQVQKGDIIIEYTGQAVRQKHLSRLFRRYKLDRRLYIMALGDGVYLDAHNKGGPARFINHSCQPNCRVERWKVKGVLRAAVVAIKPIAAMEELSFDYQWERQRGRAPTVCHCGAPNCRGTLEMPKSMEESALQQEMQGHWKKGISSKNADGIVTPDQTLVNRVVQVYSAEHQEYFLGEVTGFNADEQKHCILYRQDLKEVWEDLTKEDWMVLDDAMDRQHFHIAKKVQKRRPSPTSSLLPEHHATENIDTSIKDYVYVQTPIKEAMFAKRFLTERCQHMCGVQLTVQSYSKSTPPANDTEEAEREQAFEQSKDGLVWRISMTGSNVAKASEIVSKNIAYFERKIAEGLAAENERSKTPPPNAVTEEMIFPRHLHDTVRRRLPQVLREKCRNNVSFQLTPTDSKEYLCLKLDASLVSDMQFAKEHIWNALLSMIGDSSRSLTPSTEIPKHLAFLGGSLSREEYRQLLNGCKPDHGKTDSEESPMHPYFSLFESRNHCTVTVHADDDPSRDDGPMFKIFLGCPPANTPSLWNVLQSRIEDIARGVRFFYLGTDRVFLPLVMKKNGELFEFIKSITSATIAVDSSTSDYLKIDGRVTTGMDIVSAEELAEEVKRAALAEEILRLQIELYRDTAVRGGPWIFGRDWNLICSKAAASVNDNDPVSSKSVGKLDIVSACQGAVDIAEIVCHMDLPSSVAVHAVLILYRFVTIKKGQPTQAKIREALLACVFLATKSQKAERRKKLEGVLEAGYKTFYQGAAFDKKSEEATALEEKVIAAEKEILIGLDYDVFWRGSEALREAAGEALKKDSSRVKNLFNFAFSSQLLSAGPDLWLKFGPEYVFVAAAALLKEDFEKLMASLSLLPLKVSQAAEFIVETARLGPPRSSTMPSHKMLEVGKKLLTPHVDRVKQACMEAVTKAMIPGSNITAFSNSSTSSKRNKLVAKRNGSRLKLPGIPSHLITRETLSFFEQLSVESSSRVFLVAGSPPGTTDIVVEGHWRATAVAEEMIRQKLSSAMSLPNSVDCSSELKMGNTILQGKLNPGRVYADTIQASSGNELTMKSGGREGNASAKLGGKSCVPGKLKESSLREADLRWLISSKHNLSDSGSLTAMHLVQTQKEEILHALGSLTKALMGEGGQFPSLNSLSLSQGSSEPFFPVSLQRWPPGKIETKSAESRKADAMQVGFSPEALQELQLLTELHGAIPCSQGHPNFILPTAIALPRQNEEESQSPSTGSKVDHSLSAFDNPSVLSLFRTTKVEETPEADKSIHSNMHIIHESTPFTLQRFSGRRMKALDEIMDDVIISSWCHDLLSALVHCHSNHVVVRTIQPDQIIVDHAGVVRLGSMYRSRVLPEKDRKKQSKSIKYAEESKSSKKKDNFDKDPPSLTAPEHLLGYPEHTKESDIWQIGCLMAGLMLNRPLFRGKTRQDLLMAQYKVIGSPSSKNFSSGKRMSKYKPPPKKYHAGVDRALNTLLKERATGKFDKLVDLLSKMLQLDPSLRCTAEEALGHDAMLEYTEKSASKAFCQEFATKWLELKRAMMTPDGNEQSAERRKKRKAMIEAATQGVNDEFGGTGGDDLYDMDDLLDATPPKKAKFS